MLTAHIMLGQQDPECLPQVRDRELVSLQIIRWKGGGRRSRERYLITVDILNAREGEGDWGSGSTPLWYLSWHIWTICSYRNNQTGPLVAPGKKLERSQARSKKSHRLESHLCQLSASLHQWSFFYPSVLFCKNNICKEVMTVCITMLISRQKRHKGRGGGNRLEQCCHILAVDFRLLRFHQNSVFPRSTLCQMKHHY